MRWMTRLIREKLRGSKGTVLHDTAGSTEQRPYVVGPGSNAQLLQFCRLHLSPLVHVSSKVRYAKRVSNVALHSFASVKIH